MTYVTQSIKITLSDETRETPRRDTVWNGIENDKYKFGVTKKTHALTVFEVKIHRRIGIFSLEAKLYEIWKQGKTASIIHLTWNVTQFTSLSVRWH